MTGEENRVDDSRVVRIHQRLDEHHERIVRLEAQQGEVMRRLERLEGLPNDVSAIRSSLDELRGRIAVWTWLLALIGAGIIAAGFELLKHTGEGPLPGVSQTRPSRVSGALPPRPGRDV